MKTNFTRFRYVLAVVLCCLVSVGAWGQTEVFYESFNKCNGTGGNSGGFSGSVASSTFTPDNQGWKTDKSYGGDKCAKFGNSTAGTGVVTTPALTKLSGNATLTFRAVPFGTDGTTLKLSIQNGGSLSVQSVTLKPNEFSDYNIEIIGGTSSSTITFTPAKRFFLDEVKITLSGGSEIDKVSSPTFSPESGTEFIKNIDVTLACATDGAKIYYTTDGSTPTASSNLYSTSFSITETTTIKAIAIKEGITDSEIAEATFTKITPFNTLKEFKSQIADDKTTYVINLNNVAVTACNASNLYLQDNEAGLLIFSYEIKNKYAKGDRLNGTITGKLKNYSGLLEMIEPNFDNITATSGEEVKPIALTLAELNTEGNMAKYESMRIKIEACTITEIFTKKNAVIKQGNETFVLRAADDNIQSELNATVDVIGYPGMFNATKQFNIIAQEDIIRGSFTTDVNGTMTLTGPWASSDLSSLDLTEPTITGLDMTGITIPADAPALALANPNSLIYVANAASYPDSWKNVVEGTDALGIYLTDGSNFHNTKAFDVTEVTYTRTFAKGWNTFSLPFDATVAVGDVVEEFDAKTETSIKFKAATSIKANQAYLINIPADNTQKVFTGTGIVPVTASTGDTFKSNFTKLTGADAQGKYILVLEDGKEVFAPASEKATIAAFRGYIDLSTAPNPAKKFTIEHDGGATNVENTTAENSLKIYSENGTLVIYSNEVQNVQIFALDGRMVKNIQLSEGNNTINGLAKGIYLINNQKAIVK